MDVLPLPPNQFQNFRKAVFSGRYGAQNLMQTDSETSRQEKQGPIQQIDYFICSPPPEIGQYVWSSAAAILSLAHDHPGIPMQFYTPLSSLPRRRAA